MNLPITYDNYIVVAPSGRTVANFSSLDLAKKFLNKRDIVMPPGAKVTYPSNLRVFKQTTLTEEMK